MFVWKDKINEEEAGDGPFLKSENHPKNFTKVGSKFCQIYVAKKSKRPCECFKDTFIFAYSGSIHSYLQKNIFSVQIENLSHLGT